jgi:hypothetical protein
MDDYRYGYYLVAYDNNTPAFLKTFTTLWNITGKESKVLDECIEFTFFQTAKIAARLDAETIQTIREIFAAATTKGMRIYAAVCTARSIEPLKRFQIDPRKLIDYLNANTDTYNELLCRYEIMPLILTHARPTFDLIVEAQPHIIGYPYEEVAHIRSLVQSAIELGFILTLSICEEI